MPQGALLRGNDACAPRAADSLPRPGPATAMPCACACCPMLKPKSSDYLQLKYISASYSPHGHPNACIGHHVQVVAPISNGHEGINLHLQGSHLGCAGMS